MYVHRTELANYLLTHTHTIVVISHHPQIVMDLELHEFNSKAIF